MIMTSSQSLSTKKSLMSGGRLINIRNTNSETNSVNADVNWMNDINTPDIDPSFFDGPFGSDLTRVKSKSDLYVSGEIVDDVDDANDVHLVPDSWMEVTHMSPLNRRSPSISSEESSSVTIPIVVQEVNHQPPEAVPEITMDNSTSISEDAEERLSLIASVIPGIDEQDDQSVQNTTTIWSSNQYDQFDQYTSVSPNEVCGSVSFITTQAPMSSSTSPSTTSYITLEARRPPPIQVSVTESSHDFMQYIGNNSSLSYDDVKPMINHDHVYYSPSSSSTASFDFKASPSTPENSHSRKRNNEASRKSRVTKKQKLIEMETKAASLSAENSALEKQIKDLEYTITHYKRVIFERITKASATAVTTNQL